MWKISQPAKWGPLTSHFWRLPSDVRTNAPLRVPTRTRTPLIAFSILNRPKTKRQAPAGSTLTAQRKDRAQPGIAQENSQPDQNSENERPEKWISDPHMGGD